MNEIIRDANDYELKEREIYLDQAAMSDPSPESYVDMMINITHHWYNSAAIYEPAKEVKRKIERARGQVKKFINARDEDNVYFGSCASEMIALGIGEDNHIITSAIEHSSLERRFNSQIMQTDILGRINLKELEAALLFAKEELCDNNEKIIVAFASVNSEIGLKQDIKKIVEFAHKYGAYVLVDHSQGVCHSPIDVQKMDIDMLVMTSEKCETVPGCAILYAKKDIHISPLWSGGYHENGVRPGTQNAAPIIAFGNQLERIQDKLEERIKREFLIREEMMETIEDACNGICSVTFYPFYEIVGQRLNQFEVINCSPNILSTRFHGIDNQQLLTILDLYHVYCSSGSACSNYTRLPSHVLHSIGLSDEVINNVIRFSFDYRLKDEEVEEFGRRLKKCLSTLKNMEDIKHDEH